MRCRREQLGLLRNLSKTFPSISAAAEKGLPRPVLSTLVNQVKDEGSVALVSLSSIVERWNQWNDSLPGVGVYYPVKVNPGE
jgi:hypothetical protein